MRTQSLFALLALSACGSHPGEAVYAAECSVCHGSNGDGESESGIAGATALSSEAANLSDEDIRAAVTSGVGAMPAVSLGEDEIVDVIDYIRATFG